MAATRQHGFTLLEALVTIVVISIGLLGLLGLQSVALVSTQTSQARGAATLAADSMAGRILANPEGAAAKDYDTASSNASSGNSTPTVCTGGAVCTPAEMAAFDMSEWRQSLQQALPNGSGDISCKANDPNDASKCVEYDIKITWRERDKNNAAVADASNCGAGNGAVNRCFETLVRP
ncbi:MAG: type IV pilus modification protein PilV [Salinisphaera sp.]|jgi:type IV pilus assembly protein PilV|nr:type IV pilus modification protein PilV [Salinisphaera sp.]